ncbi:peptidase inhibitor family I36 protein [Streptomyces sp. NPDC046909]|uniref:peptidase inhibitor family I36 protein n=1 Tax=Streptomyces sp. NPDC046909 TaxID=3155617 RepID=UPI00340FCFB3
MIKRRISAAGLLHLALPAVATLSLGIAAPTTSAAEATPCPNGYFCVWDGLSETGTRQSFQRFQDDLRKEGMPNGAYSVRNNTVAYWTVYSESYCHGDSQLVAPGKAFDVTIDSVFSVAAEGYIGQCQAPD